METASWFKSSFDTLTKPKRLSLWNFCWTIHSKIPRAPCPLHPGPHKYDSYYMKLGDKKHNMCNYDNHAKQSSITLLIECSTEKRSIIIEFEFGEMSVGQPAVACWKSLLFRRKIFICMWWTWEQINGTLGLFSLTLNGYTSFKPLFVFFVARYDYAWHWQGKDVKETLIWLRDLQ